VRYLKSSRTFLVSHTWDKSGEPLLSTHVSQLPQKGSAKREQAQPGEALAEKKRRSNGGSSTRAYNGANPLKSVREVVDRWSVLTHWSPPSVIGSPVKSRPLNKVTEQGSSWRAWIGAPTPAAVAIATLRQIVVIVERSFMLVLLRSLS